MFHGPSLQGVASVDAWSEDGIDGTLRSLPTDVLGPSAAPLADPILLDAAGQLIGYWSAENERVDVFPFAVEGIELFAETLPPGRTVACRARVCRSSSATLRSDLELSCGERVHARISGWQNRCFSVPRELFELRVDPRTARLGRDLDAGRAGARCCLVDAFTDELLASGGGIWRMALAHLILSVPERREWDALQTHRERGNAWLRGRAAAKGAVRALSGTGQTPADIRIATLDTGRPCVAGDPGVSISIAHSGERAVALAAAGVAGAGIDLEPSRPLPADSVPIAFDAAELSELAAGDTESTWLTRGWCAKESVAKALGSGLDRGPGRLKVTRADRATGVITVTGTGRTMDASTLDDGETVAAICVLHHQQEGTCASRRRPLATKL
jgi:phosphopantetheinyl transferase